MAATPFIWLGSRRAHKRGVGPLGTLLDQAARARLPVASGAVLLDDFFHLLMGAGLVVESNGRILIDSPFELHAALYQDVRFPHLKSRVAVRALAEGCATSRQNIDLNDPAQLAAALGTVWTDLHRHDAASRKDVLVQEMIAPQTTGAVVLATADNAPDTIHQPGGTRPLPVLHRWQRPAAGLADDEQRLQMLLRGVRRTFGTAVARLDWADDGQICWLQMLYPSQTPR